MIDIICECGHSARIHSAVCFKPGCLCPNSDDDLYLAEILRLTNEIDEWKGHLSALRVKYEQLAEQVRQGVK